jgi:SAM-dependent methyltransferase
VNLHSQYWIDFLDPDFSKGDRYLPGYCPICDAETAYVVHGAWFRDLMICPNCDGYSIPRERAVAKVLEWVVPNWRELQIHEAAPAERGASAWMHKNAPLYSCSKYDSNGLLGDVVNGFRNENLEALTFPDESIDLLVSLDVMEHVNRVDLVMREAYRVLRPGGTMVFTTPTYKDLIATNRRALYHVDGTVEMFAPVEFHGSEDEGRAALVTYHFGYDLPELILRWSGLRTDVIRSVDPEAGIMGEHTEVYVCRKMRIDAARS